MNLKKTISMLVCLTMCVCFFAACNLETAKKSNNEDNSSAETKIDENLEKKIEGVWKSVDSELYVGFFENGEGILVDLDSNSGGANTYEVVNNTVTIYMNGESLTINDVEVNGELKMIRTDPDELSRKLENL